MEGWRSDGAWRKTVRVPAWVRRAKGLHEGRQEGRQEGGVGIVDRVAGADGGDAVSLESLGFGGLG